MRLWILAAALVAAGCGSETAPASSASPAAAPKPPPKEPEVKSDPTGKHACIKCGIRTHEDSCPKCKAVLKAEAPPPAPPRPPGEVGKSALSAVWACPKEGCTFTDPRRGTCFKHADTQLKEQWFVCAKCSVSEPVAGKCSKCGGALARTLK